MQEPFAEFPVRNESERYVPIAAAMTIIARPAICGATPAFVFDAPGRGSGKSLMGGVATTLAQGRKAAVMSWPPDPAELEKILGGFALRGASVVFFDNVNGTFGGGAMDKVLTCSDRVALRVLGASTVPELSWRAVILATGNNMAIGADTSRRTLLCRIEPQCDCPEERDGFRIANLEQWASANHPRLVAAALTVLRAYVVAGRPAQDLRPWGSFEPWRDLIANAIKWAGGPDIMQARPTVSGEDDTETAAMRAFLPQWSAFAPQGMTARSAIAALYPPERMRGQVTPDGWDAMREVIEALAPPKPGFAPTPAKLAYAMRRHRGRVVGGRALETGGDGERAGVTSWVVREKGAP